MKTLTAGVIAGAFVVVGVVFGQDPKTAAPKTAAPKTGVPKTAAPKAAAALPAPTAELKNFQDQASYSLGLTIGRNLKAQAIDLNTDMLARGMKDALSGGKCLLDDDQLQQVLTAFQQDMIRKQAAVTKAAAEKTKAEGAKYLADNARKPGVTTLPSGLQYKVVTEGKGAMPKETDTVSTHYQGTLIDGTEFDSSYKRNMPASFPVNGVIPGWVEALQLMKVGSKWQLVIPADLAYGENPPPGSPIPPNATLLFDIELLNIEK